MCTDCRCQAMVDELASTATSMPEGHLTIDYCVFNAGVLRYPNVSNLSACD